MILGYYMPHPSLSSMQRCLMNRTILSSLLATTLSTVLLSGCAGDSMIPKQTTQFTVTSKPAGATVYVMGKEVGKTPLEITTNQVFPVTYPKELENKFGRVELKYPGCQPYEKPVSGSIMANGLKAHLKCTSLAAPAESSKTASERLRQLKSLFDEGLITKDEYKAKRQKILQDL